MRWLPIAQQLRPLRSRISRRPAMYDASDSACATSKWSPHQASSRPSNSHWPTFPASCSSERSAHWPVNNVTGRALPSLLVGFDDFELHAGCPELLRGPLVEPVVGDDGVELLRAGDRQQRRPPELVRVDQPDRARGVGAG